MSNKARMQGQAKALQERFDSLLDAKAEMLVQDESGVVARLLLATLEVLAPIPIIDRTSGEIARYEWAIWFQSVFWNEGPQYSHFARVRSMSWIDANNLQFSTDTHKFTVSVIDPVSIDQESSSVFNEWEQHRRATPELKDVQARLRNEYQALAEQELNG